jgi:hypothetical protein
MCRKFLSAGRTCSALISCVLWDIHRGLGRIQYSEILCCLRFLWGSSQLVNKLSICCGTRRFITLVTTAGLFDLILIRLNPGHVSTSSLKIRFNSVGPFTSSSPTWLFLKPRTRFIITTSFCLYNNNIMSRTNGEFSRFVFMVSRLEDWLSWLRSVGIFVDYCWQMSWYYL